MLLTSFARLSLHIPLPFLCSLLLLVAVLAYQAPLGTKPKRHSWDGREGACAECEGGCATT
jgi:hypothetical protein